MAEKRSQLSVTASTSTAKNIGESSNERMDDDGWLDGDEVDGDDEGDRGWIAAVAPDIPWASPPWLKGSDIETYSDFLAK